MITNCYLSYMGNENSGNRTKREMTIKQRRRAVVLVRAGKAVRWVADKYGVSTQHIYKLVDSNYYA